MLSSSYRFLMRRKIVSIDCSSFMRSVVRTDCAYVDLNQIWRLQIKPATKQQGEQAVGGNVQIRRLSCRVLYRQLVWRPVDAPANFSYQKKGPA